MLGRSKFEPGDRVTYYSAVERLAIHHGTVLSHGRLTRDDPGEPEYRVYSVEQRDGHGSSGPWPEENLLHGWLEPLAQRS